jgi:hypothetical protein
MQSQHLFEAPFVSEVSANNCSKGISAEKCMCRSCQGKMLLRSNLNNESQWLFESESDEATAKAIIDEIKMRGNLTGSKLYAAGRRIKERSTDPILTDRVREILIQTSKKDIHMGAEQWASIFINNVKKDVYEEGRGQGTRSGRNAGQNTVATIVRQRMTKYKFPDLVKEMIELKVSQAPAKVRGGNHPGKMGAGVRKQSRKGAGRISREFEFLFEVPFIANTSYYSNAGKSREYENQRLFESPCTGQGYNYNHSESDAMFGWAKKKWEQWRKGIVNPSVSSLPSAVLDVSTLVRQLDHDTNPNRFLTREERDALTQVVTRLINRSILQKRQEILDPSSSLDRKQNLRNNLTRLVNLGRFRFLKQLPQLRNSLIKALNGTGVKFPY